MDNYQWPLQSPIDLSTNSSHYVDFDKNFLKINYKGTCSGIIQESNGKFDFIVQDYETNPQSIQFNGANAVLKKIHLHRPSEHNLEGDDFGENGGDIHLLHEITNHNHTGFTFYLVLGVFFDLCKNLTTEMDHKQEKSGFNLFASCFAQSIKFFGEGACDKVESFEIDPWKLLPGGDRDSFPGSWFWYEGSLTSPPYSENVTWVCFKDPLEDTKSDDFTNIPYQHERDTQPLNRRFVLRNFK